jgi:shikimate dehydrogenase
MVSMAPQAVARSISGRTALLAIIGDPIAQVRAPLMINSALLERGRAEDAVMVPMHVRPHDLAGAIAGLRAIRNFRGAIITMPHKVAILPLLDELTPEAKQVGACNVFRVDPSGRLIGTMFDGEGFVAGLRKAGHEVTGRRVLLLGAGGAAAGIAFALGKHGAAGLTVHNRTQARAVELGERVRRTWPSLSITAAPPYDLIVNATSLGMKAGDDMPIGTELLKPPLVAAEIVTYPEITPFLAAAAHAGCQTHAGLPMLAAQMTLMLEFMGL